MQQEGHVHYQYVMLYILNHFGLAGFLTGLGSGVSRDGSTTAGSGAACETSACSGMTSRLFKAMMSALRQGTTSATSLSPSTQINVGPH